MAGFQLNIFSQIPNSGFEDWANGDPVNWLTLDILGFADAVIQSSDAHSGSLAARLEVVDFSSNPYPPFMVSGSDGLGFPISQRHGSIIGYYKFSPQSVNDYFYIAASFKKDGNTIGGAFWETFNSSSVYTQFVISVDYFTSDTPDSVNIIIAVGDTVNGSGTIGAFALIDDLSLGGPTDVEQKYPIPLTFNLLQNYPNPFNPSTKINFSIPEQAHVELTVYDILGNKISTLVNNNYSAGEYSVDFIADNLPAGIYLARFSAGKYSRTIKMTLLK